MPSEINCPSCGKLLSVPESAAGRRAQCPGCGTTFTVPHTVADAEPVEDYDAPSRPADEQGVRPAWAPPPPPPPRPAASPSGPAEGDVEREPCPMCGELIVQGAAKCRFCGEILDPSLRRMQPRQGYYPRGPGVDLEAGDWLLAILCSGIGCIVGIAWALSGNPKGGKMIGVSVVAAIVWNVLYFAITAASRGL
jgi:predicted RNA-binding Zn-ribbon protein involved in translation (DUF1610 family)